MKLMEPKCSGCNKDIYEVLISAPCNCQFYTAIKAEYDEFLDKEAAEKYEQENPEYVAAQRAKISEYAIEWLRSKRETPLSIWDGSNDTRINFGMHKGERLGDIPADYLLFLHSKELGSSSIRGYIRHNIKVLRQEAELIELQKNDNK